MSFARLFVVVIFLMFLGTVGRATETGIRRTFQVINCEDGEPGIVPVYYVSDSFNNPDGFELIISSSLIRHIDGSGSNWNSANSVFQNQISVLYKEDENPNVPTSVTFITGTLDPGYSQLCSERAIIASLQKCAECVAADRHLSPITLVFKTKAGIIKSQVTHRNVLKECLPFSTKTGQQGAQPDAGTGRKLTP